MYNSCYIEKINDLWYICYPDCSKAWSQGYKSQKAATTVLNWLIIGSKKRLVTNKK